MDFHCALLVERGRLPQLNAKRPGAFRLIIRLFLIFLFRGWSLSFIGRHPIHRLPRIIVIDKTLVTTKEEKKKSIQDQYAA